MARYNEILVGRFNRAAQKTFSMKGPASLVTLADEAMPVFVLENFASADLRWQQSWNMATANHVFAAVAAQNNALQIRNAAGSNVVGVIQKITLSIQAAQELTVWISRSNTADLTTPFNGTVLDSRAPTNPSIIPSFQATTPSFAGFGVVWDQFCNIGVTDVVLDVDQEIPVTPGTTVLCVTNTVNTTFAALIAWRERFLEDSERN